MIGGEQASWKRFGGSHVECDGCDDAETMLVLAMELIVRKRIRPARSWQWESNEEKWRRSSDVKWNPARCHYPLRTPIDVVEWLNEVDGVGGGLEVLEKD